MTPAGSYLDKFMKEHDIAYHELAAMMRRKRQWVWALAHGTVTMTMRSALKLEETIGIDAGELIRLELDRLRRTGLKKHVKC